jgi:hypothetical protein
MNITINARKSLARDLMESALIVFEHELKLTNSKYNLNVYTERGMAKREGFRGSVCMTGEKEICMLIDSIITLAHEMVHVKQYARGQVTHSKNKKARYWMGKKVKAEYYDQPWEVEAFSKERVLANKVFAIMNKARNT